MESMNRDSCTTNQASGKMIFFPNIRHLTYKIYQYNNIPIQQYPNYGVCFSEPHWYIGPDLSGLEYRYIRI